MSSTEVALSIGSNQGERQQHLAFALRGLDSGVLGKMEVSSLWETRAVEVEGAQPDFLNLCVVGESAQSPEALLAHCHSLEKAAGRPATGTHLAPRTLDLDILYHGASERAESAISIPHPRLAGRRFVLAPLAELRPNWRHPHTGRSVAQMLNALGKEQSVTKLTMPEDWWRIDH